MNIKKNLFSIGIFIICLLIISIVITSFIRNYKVKELYKDKVISFNSKVAEQWLTAVKKNDPVTAIKTAEKIIPVQFPYLPELSYLAITKSAGINSNFFNPPASKIDFLYWRDMYLMKKIVNILNKKQNTEVLIQKIFNVINLKIRISNYNNEDERSSFYSQIWEAGKGDLIDKFLIYCVLTQQAGYNTQLGLVYGIKEKDPMHLFAVSEKNGKFYLADFMTQKFWDMSLEDFLANEQDEFKKICGKKWREGRKIIIYKSESPAMAYRKSNKLLESFLSQSKDKNIPIIGIDPASQQRAFSEFIKNRKNTAFSLGLETFLMIKNYKEFPKQWKTSK